MSPIRLSDLTAGEYAKISGYRPGSKAYRQRLLSMGLTPNTPFQLVRRAPFGDPVEIRIRGFSLSLRQHEAEILLVERVPT